MASRTDQTGKMKFVTSPIGNCTFMGTGECNDTEIYVPDTYEGKAVTKLCPRAFYKRGDITAVHLPETLDIIGQCAFEGCKSIKSIRIPKSVTYFCYEAFVACECLERVEIDDLYAWCNAYFENEDANPLHNGAALCLDGKPITHLVIPAELKSTGYASFSGCSSVTRVTVPSGIKTVSAYTFCECENLISAELAEGIERIRAYAFRGCESLTDINLPSTLSAIDECAFYGCTSLGEIALPDGIDELPDFAFHSCSSLRVVTLGKSLGRIGGFAFAGCGRLEKIIFGGSAAEWNAIPKYEDWDKDTPDYTVYCSDAVIKKSKYQV